MKKSMDVEAVAKRTLALPPSRLGQVLLWRCMLAMLYFSGTYDPSSSNGLHERWQTLIDFAEHRSGSNELDSSLATSTEARHLVSLFPPFTDIFALDALCLDFALGVTASCVRPEMYDFMFAPSSERRWMGMMAVHWYLNPFPHKYEGPAPQNEILMERLGSKANLFEDWVEFEPLFFAELVRRSLPSWKPAQAHAKTLRKLSRYPRKPLKKLDGEGSRAIRAIFMTKCLGLGTADQLSIEPTKRWTAIGDATDTKNPDRVEEMQKLRSLVRKYQQRLIRGSNPHPLQALHRDSYFMTVAAQLSDLFLP